MPEQFDLFRLSHGDRWPFPTLDPPPNANSLSFPDIKILFDNLLRCSVDDSAEASSAVFVKVNNHAPACMRNISDTALNDLISLHKFRMERVS